MIIANENASYNIRYYHLPEGETVRTILEDYDTAIEDSRMILENSQNINVDLKT
jgi:hypothetical protein